MFISGYCFSRLLQLLVLDLLFFHSCLSFIQFIIGITGLIIIFGHDLFSLIPFGNGSVIWQVLSPLINFNLYQVSPHFTFVIAYPLIPWLGIMLTGFAAGLLFELPGKKRKRIFLMTGMAGLLVFTILRLSNFYGDQSQWHSQKNIIFTFLSFINVSKYPPSLLFSLMTLGVMFLVFYMSEGLKNRIRENNKCLWTGTVFLLPDPFISYSFTDDIDNVHAGLSMDRSVIWTFSVWSGRSRVRHRTPVCLYDLAECGRLLISPLQMVWEL